MAGNALEHGAREQQHIRPHGALPRAYDDGARAGVCGERYAAAPTAWAQLLALTKLLLP